MRSRSNHEFNHLPTLMLVQTLEELVDVQHTLAALDHAEDHSVVANLAAECLGAHCAQVVAVVA